MTHAPQNNQIITENLLQIHNHVLQKVIFLHIYENLSLKMSSNLIYDWETSPAEAIFNEWWIHNKIPPSNEAADF